MQSVCSDKGVKLPWDDIGATMEERVSGGAIIQHISKLRQRLEAMGKNVPPPPRRGGGYGNSNSRGRNTNLGTQDAVTPAAPRRTRASANIRSKVKMSETEEEEIGVDGASGSEEEFGNPKSHSQKADDEEIKQEDQNVAGNAGGKRKRDGDSNSPFRGEKRPAGRKSQTRKRRKGNHRASSSVSSCEDAGSRDASPESDADGYQQDSVGRQYLAVGADFFQDYDQDDASTPRASSSGKSHDADRIVVLRLGESERGKAFLQQMQSHERAARGTDAESVASSSTTSIARFDGGRESIEHGGEATSNIADTNYHSMSLGNSSQLSQEYHQRLPQVPLSNTSSSFVVNSSYSSTGPRSDSLLGRNNAIYNSSVISNRNFQVSSDWDLQAMPAKLVSTNFAAPVGYSAHTTHQANLGLLESPNNHSDSFSYPSSHADNLGQESGWNGPLAFGHGSAISPGAGFVAPTTLSRNHTGAGPILYGNAFSRSQASLGGGTQQVQGSAVINSAPSAEIPVSTFSAINSFLPDNTSAIQVPDIDISEEMNWTDFLDDLHGIDDVFNTNLMTNIPGERNDNAEVED